MKKLSKIFAVVLVLALALSMLPMGAAAASNWTEVQLSSVTANDMIAIVVVTADKTMALKNNADKGPAVAFTTSMAATPEMLWTLTATTGGYYVQPLDVTDKYLSSTNDNNGLQITATKGIWKADVHGDYTYFATTDTSGNYRTMGFTAQNNFRAYKLRSDNTINTVTNQNVKFYKWTGAKPGDNREDLPTASGAIVDAIFGLQSGETLSSKYKYEGEITLTGTVSGTTTWYDNSSTGNVNFKVKDSSNAEKTMQAYKLGKGTNTTDEDVKNLATGDTITVKGSVIKNYNGTYEFDGCTLVSVTKGQVTLPALPTDTAEIVDAIYDLEAGESLDAYYEFESFTLSGTVVGDVKWNEQYGDGELTIKVEGTDKELLAYQYKAGTVGEDVAAALAAGDKVTFNVEAAKNYNGTYEMVKPVLTNVVKGSTPSGTTPAGTTAAAGTNPDTGDTTAIVSMTAVMTLAVTVLAVLVIGNKKKFF